MQSRHTLPGWYGIRDGAEQFVAGTADGTRLVLLQDMYQHWPFFRTIIDNAQMILGKADLDIARRLPIWCLIRSPGRRGVWRCEG